MRKVDDEARYWSHREREGFEGRGRQVTWPHHKYKISFLKVFFFPTNPGLTNHHGASVLNDVSESVLPGIAIMPVL